MVLTLRDFDFLNLLFIAILGASESGAGTYHRSPSFGTLRRKICLAKLPEVSQLFDCSHKLVQLTLLRRPEYVGQNPGSIPC
jgi:hypothetical protein